MSQRILTEIWIYPVKSLGGVRLATSRVLGKGLVHDRRWMLIDDSNTFMTQRIYPALSLFKIQATPDGFHIRHHSTSIDLFPGIAPQGPALPATVWDDSVEVLEVSEHHSAWFSEQLSMPCRLVSFPEENPRLVDPRYSLHLDHVSLADGYPFLIIGEASVADLNTRLDVPVPMNRFRPNLVFSGGEPYEEDRWSTFAVGKNHFQGVKPCGRCVMTTVNQETAENGLEPLATLAGYRKQDGKVNFGQNLVALDYDEICEGDEITF